MNSDNKDNDVYEMDNLKILSKLCLSKDEEDVIRKDLDNIIGYIKDISMIDTEGIQPMTHFEEYEGVFHEDEVTNADFSEALLGNAPVNDEEYLCVPKTIN